MLAYLRPGEIPTAAGPTTPRFLHNRIGILNEPFSYNSHGLFRPINISQLSHFIMRYCTDFGLHATALIRLRERTQFSFSFFCIQDLVSFCLSFWKGQAKGPPKGLPKGRLERAYCLLYFCRSVVMLDVGSLPSFRCWFFYLLPTQLPSHLKYLFPSTLGS